MGANSKLSHNHPEVIILGLGDVWLRAVNHNLESEAGFLKLIVLDWIHAFKDAMALECMTFAVPAKAWQSDIVCIQSIRHTSKPAKPSLDICHEGCPAQPAVVNLRQSLCLLGLLQQ